MFIMTVNDFQLSKSQQKLCCIYQDRHKNSGQVSFKIFHPGFCVSSNHPPVDHLRSSHILKSPSIHPSRNGVSELLAIKPKTAVCEAVTVPLRYVGGHRSHTLAENVHRDQTSAASHSTGFKQQCSLFLMTTHKKII